MTKPFDVVNEQMVLAAAMCSQQAARRVLAMLSPEDMGGRKHRVILAAIDKCVRQDIPLSPATVVAESSGDCGGVEYLKKIALLDVDDPDLYVARQRQSVAVDKAIEEMGKAVEFLEEGGDYFECVKAALKPVEILRSVVLFKDGRSLSSEWLSEFEAGTTEFRTTGYDSLDEILTDGFRKGHVTVVAGRPRAGKSMFVADMVRRQLEKEVKPRILVGAFEGGKDSFADLIVSSATKIEIEDLVKFPESLTDGARKRIKRVVKKMLGTDDRLTVIGNPFVALGENWNNATAIAKVEEILAEGSYDLAVFDLWERCLTVLDPQRIAAALIKMQVLAATYRTHVIIVQQLGRRVEDRTKIKSRRPSLVDLKNSGAYEEIANNVFLVHREKIYKRFVRDDLIEVIVAKQKRGQDGVAMVADFVPEICRLVNDRIVAIEELFSTRAPSMMKGED